MRLKGNLMIFSLIVLFSIGLALGLTRGQDTGLDDRQDGYQILPDTIKYGPSNNQKPKDDISFSGDNDDKPPISSIQGKNDGEIEESYTPDTEYYKKAELLQRQFPDVFIMKSQTRDKRIALTFDDGPDNKTTPEILNILDQYNVPATFFIVGKNVEHHPAIIKRMVDEGHQVANHSWSHLRPTGLTDQNFISEITPVKEVLEKYADPSAPLYYRPPYGLLTPAQVNQISEKGYLVISWSIDSLDWAVSSSEKIRDKVIDSIHPGAIILMHSAGGKDGRLGTVKALPEIINNLSGQGYKFVTLHELIKGE